MAYSKFIVIVGCGRLGGNLAQHLSTAGHQVVVVDRRPASFDKLAAEYTGYQVLGDVTELSTLKEAQIEKADYVLATTTEDNINLMVAQVAKTCFNVPRVVARVYDPAREAIYRELGIEIVSPIKLSSAAFLEKITL